MKASMATALLILFGAFLVFQGISKSQDTNRLSTNSGEEFQNKASILQVLTKPSNQVLPISVTPGPTLLSPPKTVESLMEDYNSKSNEELRRTIKQLGKLLDDHDLINKSNTGQLTEAQKRELIMIVRLNTALNRLLIDRALESSRI